MGTPKDARLGEGVQKKLEDRKQGGSNFFSTRTCVQPKT